jgi:hypothetical protein
MSPAKRDIFLEMQEEGRLVIVSRTCAGAQKHFDAAKRLYRQVVAGRPGEAVIDHAKASILAARLRMGLGGRCRSLSRQ